MIKIISVSILTFFVSSQSFSAEYGCFFSVDGEMPDNKCVIDSKKAPFSCSYVFPNSNFGGICTVNRDDDDSFNLVECDIFLKDKMPPEAVNSNVKKMKAKDFISVGILEPKSGFVTSGSAQGPAGTVFVGVRFKESDLAHRLSGDCYPK